MTAQMSELQHTVTLTLLAVHAATPSPELASAIYTATYVGESMLAAAGRDDITPWMRQCYDSGGFVILDTRGRWRWRVYRSTLNGRSVAYVDAIELPPVAAEDRLYATGGGTQPPSGERPLDGALASETVDESLFSWAETAAVGDEWCSRRTFDVGTAAGEPVTRIRRVY